MRDAPGHYNLPDFCAGRSVAVVLLVCQLLAFVVVASSAASAELPAIRLLKVSLFLHWLGLMSALTLCAARRLLVRLRVDWLSTAAFLLVIATTADTYVLCDVTSHTTGRQRRLPTQFPDFSGDFHAGKPQHRQKARAATWHHSFGPGMRRRGHRCRPCRA